MILETFPVGPLHCNCTILGDEVTREAMVVDPGDNIPEILSRLHKHGLTLRQIVVTHAHIDHVGGAAQLRKATGAPVVMNQQDLGLLGMMEMQAGWLGVPTPEVAPPDASAEDGQTIGLAALPAQVLHTPGHTQGSICLLFPDQHLLLAGDTLFAGPICPGAMDTKSCARCVIACWCSPMPHAWFLVTARKRPLVKKDNQIHFFSRNSACDTLTLPKGDPIVNQNKIKSTASNKISGR
jgi:hydroxyacylglutathione hydrolase